MVEFDKTKSCELTIDTENWEWKEMTVIGNICPDCHGTLIIIPMYTNQKLFGYCIKCNKYFENTEKR